jgi:hypothetical protein
LDVAKLSEKVNPFAALIGVSSLLAALLYVAGFSYRWSYFYNFGVQHLVYKLGFQSFLITALELIRTPRNIVLVLLAIVVPVLVLNLLIAGVAKAADSNKRSLRRAAIPFGSIGLQSQLVIDLLRAAVIVYATYRVASWMGYEAFQSHIRNDPRHPLPAVTAVFDAGGEGSRLSLACGGSAATLPPFVGDAKRLRELQTFHRTCNSGKITWRLLYRDDEAIYLFAAEPAENVASGKRPLTLVLPNRGTVSLVME